MTLRELVKHVLEDTSEWRESEFHTFVHGRAVLKETESGLPYMEVPFEAHLLFIHFHTRCPVRLRGSITFWDHGRADVSLSSTLDRENWGLHGAKMLNVWGNAYRKEERRCVIEDFILRLIDDPEPEPHCTGSPSLDRHDGPCDGCFFY